MSRHRPYVVWGLLLVGLVLGVGVLMVPGGSWVALDQRRSSLRTTPDGIAAWARSLEALGVHVERRFVDLEAAPPTQPGLVLLEPIVALSAGEAHAVVQWVRDGGVLVFSPGFRSLLADSLGIDLVTPPTDPFGSPDVTTDSLIPHPWTDTPAAWQSAHGWRVAPDSSRREAWLPLTVSRGRGASLAWLSEGEGGVLVLAEAEELANRALADSRIAVTVTRAVVDLLDGGTIAFSEYHQGQRGSRGLMREALALAARQPLGRLLLYLGVTGALLLVLAGRRFGAPLPEPPGPRRSTLEHVDAVARIYRAGRSYRTVAHYLVRSAARRMRLPGGADSDEDLLRRWRGRPGLEGPARAAAEALERHPPDLRALERALDDLVERHQAV